MEDLFLHFSFSLYKSLSSKNFKKTSKKFFCFKGRISGGRQEEGAGSSICWFTREKAAWLRLPQAEHSHLKLHQDLAQSTWAIFHSFQMHWQEARWEVEQSPGSPACTIILMTFFLRVLSSLLFTFQEGVY